MCKWTRKKKKKKKKREKERASGRRKKKASGHGQNPYALAQAFFSSQVHFFSSSFLPFQGENFLVGPVRKHQGPTFSFPSSPPNQTHSKKFPLLIYIYSSFLKFTLPNIPLVNVWIQRLLIKHLLDFLDTLVKI